MYGTEGCSEFMAEKLPYSAIIGKHVRKGISSGVSVKDIMASIQKYSHAPSIGNVVVEQALAGDFKAAELYLRSKGGWSPTNTVEEREVGSEEEEDRSAVEEIMTRLGKNNLDDDEHEDNG